MIFSMTTTWQLWIISILLIECFNFLWSHLDSKFFENAGHVFFKHSSTIQILGLTGSWKLSISITFPFPVSSSSCATSLMALMDVLLPIFSMLSKTYLKLIHLILDMYHVTSIFSLPPPLLFLVLKLFCVMQNISDKLHYRLLPWAFELDRAVSTVMSTNCRNSVWLCLNNGDFPGQLDNRLLDNSVINRTAKLCICWCVNLSFVLYFLSYPHLEQMVVKLWSLLTSIV